MPRTKSGLLPGAASRPHDQVGVVAGAGVQDAEGAGVLQLLDRPRIDGRGQLHVAREQRVDPGALIGQAEELDLVEPGAIAPVAFVAHRDRAHARRELLALERAGADRGGEILGAVLDDVEMGGAQDHREIGVRSRQLDADLVRPGRADLLHRCCEGLGLAADLRVEMALQRIDHVLSREGLAVVEGDALPQLEGPDRGLVVLDRLRQLRLRLAGFVDPGQLVVEQVAADIVGRRRLLGRVERVGGRAGVAGDADAAAALRRVGQRPAGVGEHRPAGGQSHAGHPQHAQHVAPRGAAAQRVQDPPALGGAHRFEIADLRHAAVPLLCGITDPELPWLF